MMELEIQLLPYIKRARCQKAIVKCWKKGSVKFCGQLVLWKDGCLEYSDESSTSVAGMNLLYTEPNYWPTWLSRMWEYKLLPVPFSCREKTKSI